MKKIYKNISELVGKTPLINIEHFSKLNNLECNILVKLEYFNPTGSVKDRIAKQMIEDAEEKGLLKKDSVIIEPTSGNTGIGIAAIGVSKGYRVIIVMPETMTLERRKMISAYGAELILTDGTKGMKGAIEKANSLAKEIKNSFIPSQFENPSNPKAHKISTGPEIWEDTEGNIDIFIAGIGTGGTISGVGQYLKEKKSDIKIIGIEPEKSPVLTEGKSGSHTIQGIGAGFIPNTLDITIYDEIIKVKDEDAYKMVKELAKTEGIFVGISSGAALWTAVEISKRSENKNKNIVVIIPDSGNKYFSTNIFE